MSWNAETSGRFHCSWIVLVAVGVALLVSCRGVPTQPTEMHGVEPAISSSLSAVPHFYLDVPVPTVGCGERLRAAIMVNNLDALGFSIAVPTDGSIRPVSATPGALMDGSTIMLTYFDTEEPLFVIDGVGLGQMLTGSGALVELEFVSTGIPGEQDLMPGVVFLRDFDNQEMARTEAGATLESSCQVLAGGDGHPEKWEGQ